MSDHESFESAHHAAAPMKADEFALNDHRAVEEHNAHTAINENVIVEDTTDIRGPHSPLATSPAAKAAAQANPSPIQQQQQQQTSSSSAHSPSLPSSTTVVQGEIGRRRLTRRRSSANEKPSFMTTLRRDFYLKDDDDVMPIINNPHNGRSRRRSTLENLQPIIKKKTMRSNSNNLETDLLSPMTKTKTVDSFNNNNNNNNNNNSNVNNVNNNNNNNNNNARDKDEDNRGRRGSKSSIDSDDSHASRSSQETEEDVCFPMMREHIRINGIDFDEIDEFIREERDEAAMQQEFISRNKLTIEELEPHEKNRSTSLSRQKTQSQAAMKYTPRNILKSFSKFEEVQDTETTTSSSDEVKFKKEANIIDEDDSSSEQVKFGGARISDGTSTQGSLPDRFSFFHSESEETVHAPDIPSLVTNGQSIRELFRDGQETWWLDCTCPTDAEMKMLAKAFGIHPLTAEDIRMQETREKVELFKSYYFVCFHTFEPDKESEDYLEPINVYIVVFRDGILTFHFSPISHPANVRRRVRQLRDYVDVTADWLCYAMIDDITDGFAPVIHGIEYEADAIEDAVFVARDTDFSNMLQRIGESRRKVMTLMRLLSGKADVIKMFAKRCQDELALGYQKQLRQQQQQQHQYQQQYQPQYPYVAPQPTTASTTTNAGADATFGPGPTPVGIGASFTSSTSPTPGAQQPHQPQQAYTGAAVPPPPPPFIQPSPFQTNWTQNNSDNARPRADIALYLGDIQDHIITMFQNLLAYEKIFSRSHSNYLAQLQVESFNSNNKISEMFSKVTIIGTMLVPLNLVTGMFGMNVRVPGEQGSIAWFFGILGVLIVVIIVSIFLANWWLKRMNRKLNSEPRPVFNSRRSIRSLGLKRHSAKSIISFPNKYD